MMPLFPLRLFLLFFAVLWLTPAFSNEGQNFFEREDSKKHVLILVGAAVDERRTQEFSQGALSLRELFRADYGYSQQQVKLLMGDQNSEAVDGSSRAESIRSTFTLLSQTIKPDDQLTVILIGHGTGSGDMAKFNIVGPDLSGPQFSELLDSINTQNIVVINTTSASHDFSKALTANGRVVVSATRSAAEKYDTVFPRYFIAALHDRAADRDKNGRISVLEAFTFAKAGTESYFRGKGTLATEHAVLDDNGDGVFSERPDSQGDGRLAEIAYLDVADNIGVALSPAAAALRTQMNNLERDIFALRGNKTALDETDYWAQLEPLLIQLAKVTREFDDVSKP